MKKLNLGSGTAILDGYDNIDIANGRGAYPLDYIEDGSCDEIRASHILEHFPHEQTYAVLSEWVKKLTPGGVLKIAVPDFNRVAKNYLQGMEQETQKIIMGAHSDGNDYHKAIFDKASLSGLMEAAGLELIVEWNDYNDTCSLPISLNLQGVKPSAAETADDGPVKITAVMSMPRLAFTDNLFTAHKCFLPLGINIEKGTGVFWGQVLTNMIQKNLDSEYIITLDYDSMFDKDHVIRLCQLMQENPDVDAIVPVQVKREEDATLYGATKEQLRESGNLVPITTGHFGLTIFRTSAFAKLSKPWILPVPNSDGEWGEGRIDEDIYFWHNWQRSGCKTMLAKEVCIGHLQLMVSYPDTEENDYRPVHRYLNDVNHGKTIPDNCQPKVSFL